MKVQRSILNINHGTIGNHEFELSGIPDSQEVTILLYGETVNGTNQSSANVIQGRMHPNAPWHTISSLGSGTAVLQTTTNPYPFIRVRVTSNSGVGTRLISKVSIF